jgi:hypothetical protein
VNTGPTNKLPFLVKSLPGRHPTITVPGVNAAVDYSVERRGAFPPLLRGVFLSEPAPGKALGVTERTLFGTYREITNVEAFDFAVFARILPV